MSQHSIAQLQTLLSVVKAATGTLKMCFSIICVGQCSSIRHTDWHKPRLRMPSLTITHGPQPLPPTRTPQERQAVAVIDCSVILTWGLSASHCRWFWESQLSLPCTLPILFTGMCPETPLGDSWFSTSFSGYMGSGKRRPESPKPSAAKQSAPKTAIFPDDFQIETSLIKMLFLAQPMK